MDVAALRQTTLPSLTSESFDANTCCSSTGNVSPNLRCPDSAFPCIYPFWNSRQAMRSAMRSLLLALPAYRDQHPSGAASDPMSRWSRPTRARYRTLPHNSFCFVTHAQLAVEPLLASWVSGGWVSPVCGSLRRLWKHEVGTFLVRTGGFVRVADTRDPVPCQYDISPDAHANASPGSQVD